MKRSLALAAMVALFLGMQWPRLALAEEMLEAAWWLERHGHAPESERTRLAQTVFQRVLAVADTRSRQRPRLVVLHDDARLLAFCLPDGAVLLSTAALAHCLGEDREPDSAGAARLAFVLGHELGHLADDDYWHARTVGQLQRFGPEKGLARLLSGETTEQLQRLELKADARGFLYAAMAGFGVHRLQGEGAAAFFEAWTNRGEVRALAGDSHPDPAARAALVQSRLRLLEPVAVQFDWAVRLAAAGDYVTALELFDAVSRVFDAREVLANMAVCHLQLGVLGLSPPYRLEYWLPVVLDDSSMAARALGGVRGAGEGDSLLPEERFRQALSLAQQALEKDPDHLPSLLVAAAASLRLGAGGGKAALYQGLAMVEEGLSRAQDDMRLRMLHALLQAAAIPERKTDSIKALRSLIEKAPTAPHLHFALARLLEDAGDDAAAMPHWEALAQNMGQLPPLVAGLAAGRTGQPLPLPADQSPCGGAWLAIPAPGDNAEAARSAQPSPDWRRMEVGGLVIHDLPETLSFVSRDGLVRMAAIPSDVEPPEACRMKPGLNLVSGRSVAQCCDGGMGLVRSGRLLERWRVAPQP